jgi:hypothetical protein
MSNSLVWECNVLELYLLSATVSVLLCVWLFCILYYFIVFMCLYTMYVVNIFYVYVIIILY